MGDFNQNGNQVTSDRLSECIILAGGFGTRLKETVPDLPKSLAPVAGRPFLSHLIDHLRMQGISRFIFSLGYMSDKIEAFLQEEYPTLDYSVVIEDEPLGTGGGISHALQKLKGTHVLVTNGDTLFKACIEKLFHAHLENNAICTMALKPMKSFDRYGAVEISTAGKVTSFLEKNYYEQGNINGGLYVLNGDKFKNLGLPGKFSFEKEFLEKFYSTGQIFGLILDSYFIDIGIPEDLQKAQKDLERPLLDLKVIDKTWTLFLDRDGVINDEKLGHYVLHWGEFIFSTGVLNIFRKLFEKFGRIIVVSNQRGVGKGLMTEAGLQSIHLEMQREVEIAGARIEKIYYCIEKDDRNFFRKPNPGMAYLAMKDFPEIDPSKAVMVGNKPSDMRFGRSAGFYTIFVKTTNPDQPFPHKDIDAIFPSLPDFAQAL
jgi:D-glycero-alpha-D-manno-heptose 1-phosphate guanylyltransferase